MKTHGLDPTMIQAMLDSITDTVNDLWHADILPRRTVGLYRIVNFLGIEIHRQRIA